LRNESLPKSKEYAIHFFQYYLLKISGVLNIVQIYKNEENLTLVKKPTCLTQFSNIFDNFEIWFE